MNFEKLYVRLTSFQKNQQLQSVLIFSVEVCPSEPTFVLAVLFIPIAFFYVPLNLAPGGGGLFPPMMAYTGRLRPKGVHFSGCRSMKGLEFHLLKYMKGYGNLSFGSVKGPKRASRGILWLYKVEKTLYFSD